MDQLIELVRDLLHLALRGRIAHRHPERGHRVAVGAGGGDGVIELLQRHLTGHALGSFGSRGSFAAVAAAGAIDAIGPVRALRNVEGEMQRAARHAERHRRRITRRHRVHRIDLRGGDRLDRVDEIFEAVELGAHLHGVDLGAGLREGGVVGHGDEKQK
jgi:hypothetical protein